MSQAILADDDFSAAVEDSDLDVPERFCVKDEDTANWVVRHIISARQYQDRVKKWAEKEILRAEREEQFFLQRFSHELSAWTSMQIAKLKGKRKSVALPAGTLGFRRVDSKLVIDDESVVISWAKKCCPTAVTVVPQLSKAEVNQHVKSTGEFPDGAHVEPASERFYVR